MEKEDILNKIPQDGFIKLSKTQKSSLSSSDKVVLNRRGNEFFNQGKIEEAMRIFLTTGYSDGLVRVGDYFQDHGEPLRALRMYWLAPAPDRKEKLLEDFAGVIRKWIHEEGRDHE